MNETTSSRASGPVPTKATVDVSGSDAGRAYYMGGAPAVLIRVDRTAEGDAIYGTATEPQFLRISRSSSTC